MCTLCNIIISIVKTVVLYRSRVFSGLGSIQSFARALIVVAVLRCTVPYRAYQFSGVAYRDRRRDA